MTASERKLTLTIVAALAIAIVLLASQACTTTCKPCKPCKRGYELRGDTCYKVKIERSRIY